MITANTRESETRLRDFHDSSLYAVRRIEKRFNGYVINSSHDIHLFIKKVYHSYNKRKREREKKREKENLRYNTKGHRSMNPIQSHARRDLRATIWAADHKSKSRMLLLTPTDFLQ